MYHSRKYKLNENFFSPWSPEMAYVLGFWYADGNMRRSKSYRIGFFSVDYDHLAGIAELFSSGSSVLLNRGCYELTVRSKKLFYDLYSLGGRPAKSTSLVFPSVADEYMGDFIRGYFDGDGSVHHITYKASKTESITQTFAATLLVELLIS